MGKLFRTGTGLVLNIIFGEINILLVLFHHRNPFLKYSFLFFTDYMNINKLLEMDFNTS